MYCDMHAVNVGRVREKHVILSLFGYECVLFSPELAEYGNTSRNEIP